MTKAIRDTNQYPSHKVFCSVLFLFFLNDYWIKMKHQTIWCNEVCKNIATLFCPSDDVYYLLWSTVVDLNSNLLWKVRELPVEILGCVAGSCPLHFFGIQLLLTFSQLILVIKAVIILRTKKSTTSLFIFIINYIMCGCFNLLYL